MKYGAVAIVGTTLSIIIAVSFMAPHSAMADSYEKSQVISQTNECSNYWFPVNIICSNLNSQVQGDENNVAITTTTTTTTPTNPNTDPDTNFGPPFP